MKLADAPTNKDAFNTATFPEVLTDSLRLSMKNSTESTGIIEWRVYGTTTETLPSGKQLYIPNEWGDPNANIPWDSTNRCKQSANFALFWGPLAGNDPLHNTDPAFQFDPEVILDSMEAIWNDYVTQWHLIPDSGSIARYKNIIVINNTWRDGLYTGYAFGGGYDGKVGAFWVETGVFKQGNSFVASHEFAHSCQYIISSVLYPGHGFTDASNGFFWESHANFMAWQRNPSMVWAMDPARAYNFTSYTQSSDRKHYANVYYMELLRDKYGLDFVNRIWREADATNQEHPFQTIQRLLGLDQDGINAFFMEYAMHNVNWDYEEKGDDIRNAMAGLDASFQWRPTNLLDSLSKGHYAIPDNLAPQQYGYNIIRLYPDSSACITPSVYLTFKGHIDPNTNAGWRYGFVSVDANGNSTYSSQYAGNESETGYQFPANAVRYYLVVSGAPTAFYVHTGQFSVGFPKEYRYPWEIHIKEMIPEGYQPNFRDTAGLAGAPHPNGGGFVAATAHVDATAYVAPGAAVLNAAQVTDNARIEGKAVIKDNAKVMENAVVSDFARITGGSVVKGKARVNKQALLNGGAIIGDSAIVTDNAVMYDGGVSSGGIASGNLFAWGGAIGGTAAYGGDAELFGACDAGDTCSPMAWLFPAERFAITAMAQPTIL